MPDPTPPTTKPSATVNGAELPPRLLAKLKVEIDGYELLDRLDEGGQATVYKGIQKKDGRVVAIKVLHGGPHATDEARARLKREINALRAINHPNIVQAIAAGRTRSGLDCLVMNFIDGKPLDALWTDPAFAATVAPQPADLLRLFKTICETVQAAHRKGITHRDLSPSNILIDASGQPHILDFGMASTAFDGIVTRNVTVTGQFIGKIKYASPEQASGARTTGANGEAASGGVDIRSDVYALGVMLYQLLTGGAFPYEVVGNVIDVLNNIIKTKPKPPSETVAELHTPTAAMAAGFGGTGVPPVTKPTGAPAPIRRNPPLVNETIEAIVLKALEKDPAQRYQSAGELAADIDRYLAGQPTSAVVWSKRPKPASTSRPFRRAAILAASVAFSATLVGVTMNAKSLAVWLGLATAAAPVLPTELTPLAPSTANAAMMVAALGDETDGQLTDLAHELARVESRLRAVNNLISLNTNRKPPEAAANGQDSGQWLSADAFCDAVAKAAAERGRTIPITPLDAAAREDVKQAESNASGADPSEDALLIRRAALDAEYAIICSRFSWGALTGRDDDRLFRFSTTVVPDANPAAIANQRVIDTGVRFRRTLDAALTQGALRLRSDSAEGEGGAPDLRTVLDTIVDQTKPSLDAFRKAIGNARDQDGRSEEDTKTLAALAATAKDLAAALTDAADKKNHPEHTADEPARAAALARLQRALGQTSDLGAGVETQLVALRQAWAVALDMNKELSEIKLARAARPQPPARPQAPARQAEGGELTIADLFPIGSVWEGRYVNETNAVNGRNATGRVIRHDGKTVVLEVQVSGYALRQRYIDVTGNKLQQWKDEGVSAIQESGVPPNKFSAININGEVKDGTLTLSGTQDVHSNAGKFLLNERGTLTLKQKNYRPLRKPAAAHGGAVADPLEAWQVGSRWTTPNPSGGGVTVWSVRSRNGNQLEIQRPSVQGNGFVVVQLTVARDGGLTVTQVRHQDTPGAVLNRDWGGSGRLTANSLRLNYFTHSSNNAGRTYSRWDESINLKPE